MFESNLPKRFWGKSVLMATHFINILPSSVLKWKTPYEILHKKQPNYSQLKFFECLYFATNIYPFKNKFDARAHKCIFLGYKIGVKAYKLYDVSNKKKL